MPNAGRLLQLFLLPRRTPANPDMLVRKLHHDFSLNRLEKCQQCRSPTATIVISEEPLASSSTAATSLRSNSSLGRWKRKGVAAEMAQLKARTCPSLAFICLAIAYSFTNCETIDNLPGSAFAENNGFEAAIEAAPVWLFGRSWNRNPCYPDSATINNGNDPNPGRGPPGGPPAANPNPGDCRDPGPWTGTYSSGASFPNYINCTYCSDKNQWYVTYSLYYVHDGALSEGHINDWESATVVWGRQADGADFWSRQSLILSKHSGHDTYSWNDIESVDDPTDQDESTGQDKKHPKVYVGFFKHANFPNRKTNINVFDALAPNNEFRSHDWYFLPQMQDMHAGSEIHSDWSYGEATSTPATINPCSF